jgi:hypothetical protein
MYGRPHGAVAPADGGMGRSPAARAYGGKDAKPRPSTRTHP